MKKLLAIGDSFTYGYELEEKLDSWPNVLGTLIDYKVTNFGIPGSSNNKMVRNALISAREYDLVIVGWSVFTRIEYADGFGSFDVWPGREFYNTVEHQSRKTVYEYLNKNYNEEWLYNQYLCNIISLQSFLKQNQIKYLMFDAFENNNHRNLGKTDLINLVDTEFFITWPDKSLMDWVYGIDNSRAPKGHLSNIGHRVVAERIYEYIRNFGWVS